MGQEKNLIGFKYGRLTVITKSRNQKIGEHTIWRCKCDCGNMHVVSGRALRNGHSRSCGCLRKETTTLKNFKHGDSTREKRERLYGIWGLMKGRCSNPKIEFFPIYGGRGIKVCKAICKIRKNRTWRNI